MKKNTSIIIKSLPCHSRTYQCHSRESGNPDNNTGFSLLEITIVLIIVSILLSAVIPVLSRSYLEKAASKTALDISAIQEASRKFYIDNNQWPAATSVYSTPLAALQAGNYLPSAWSAINPFGTSAAIPANYTYSVTSNASSLTVCTLVPSSAQNIIQNSLTLPYVDANGNLCSSVSVPGALSVLPSGAIIAWPTASVPAGFLPCDGGVYNISTYPGLASVLGSTYGGNGSTTFAVPDLRGRTIVGLNTLTTNDGTNRIWSTDTYSNNQGQSASYYVNQIGGVFGEEKHRQTLVEMAPHTHGSMLLQSPGDNSHGLPGGSGTGYGNSGVAGGNGDGTGLGFAANVVQPSMALVYIIKT